MAKKMTIDEIVQDLKALADYFKAESGGSVPLCIPSAIEALEESKMTELEKLKKWLDENGYDARWHDNFGKKDQVIVYEKGKRSWDVICSIGSYGGKQGLLEVYGNICEDVIGWLKAEDVIKLLERRK